MRYNTINALHKHLRSCPGSNPIMSTMRGSALPNVRRYLSDRDAVATLALLSATAPPSSPHIIICNLKSRCRLPPGWSPGSKHIALQACHTSASSTRSSHSMRCERHAHPRPAPTPSAAPACCAQRARSWQAACTCLEGRAEQRTCPLSGLFL